MNRREKISVISGISVSAQGRRRNLYYYLFYDNIGQEEVVLCLRHLLRHLRGPVIVLLDNSNTHKGQPLDDLRRRHPRLRIENFPSYTPELNPDEGVWRQAKRTLANSCPKDIDELMEDVLRPINGVKGSQKKLRACLEGSELPSFCAKPLHYLYVDQELARANPEALRTRTFTPKVLLPQS